MLDGRQRDGFVREQRWQLQQSSVRKLVRVYVEKVQVDRREWFEVWKQEVFGSVPIQVGVLKLTKVFSCTSELRKSLTKLKDY